MPGDQSRRFFHRWSLRALHLRIRQLACEDRHASTAGVGALRLSKQGMPQDIRISPDGKVFYVADMMADGVFLIDGVSFSEIGFIATGIGAHGLYPSRDATELYVSNRGSHEVHGLTH